MKFFAFRLFLSLSLPFFSLLPAQSPSLLRDINLTPRTQPNPASSNPKGITQKFTKPWENNKFPRINSFFFFSATDGSHGIELWKAMASPLTAVMVKDINPGSAGSSPSSFLVYKNVLYFSADDGSHGKEVWRSDGTPGGTYLFNDSYNGKNSGGFYYPIIMGGNLYWTSSNGTTYDIWKSDGSKAGTKKIFSGLNSYWSNPTNLGNKILFQGYTLKTGFEPWITDGTTSGTKILMDVWKGTGPGYAYFPYVLNGKAFFFSNPGTWTLFVTDGTSQGTKPIKGGFRTFWYNAISLGNKIIFRAMTTPKGFEPWVTDGTKAGTFLLKDILPGPSSGGFNSPILYKNKVLFEALTPTTSLYSIWETDGTTKGTRVLTSKTRTFKEPTIMGSLLYFKGRGLAVDNGEELWVTDGTHAGTKEVKDLNPGSPPSSPGFLTGIGNFLVFAAKDKIHGNELWLSDGTPNGTILLGDIYGSGNSSLDSNPRNFIDVLGTVYFTADDGIHGRELWKTDGTYFGTELLLDINPGKGNGASLSNSTGNYWRPSGPHPSSSLGKILFFEGYTPSTGYEIWRTDGTKTGTKLLKDIYPGANSGHFYHGCRLGNFVYFFAFDKTGYSLWKTDGTTSGTVKVTGGFSRYWDYPLPYRGKIFFMGAQANTGQEPWVTDGTKSGTKIIKNIRPGSYSGYFNNPVAANNKVFFQAYLQNSTNYSLWVIDTSTLTANNIYSTSRGIGYNLVALGSKAFFQGWDYYHGYEIWVTDGSRVGTHLFKDIYLGRQSGYFSNPCAQGKKLFFSAWGRLTGNELWVTDGTTQGTQIVKNINPNPFGSSNPSSLTPIGERRVVFRANDGKNGNELWISDGSSNGTRLAGDIAPGPGSSAPSQMTLSRGTIYFSANNGLRGFEPWTYFPGATAQKIGFGTNPQFSTTATDPVLGGQTVISILGMNPGQGGVILLTLPTNNYSTFGKGLIYVDLFAIQAEFMVSPGIGGKITLPVPNNPILIGGRMVTQGVVYPTTGLLGIDLTNGIFLTLGK